MRKKIIAVIGDAGIKHNHKKYLIAEKLGKALIDNGYRVMNGGLRGIMEAVSKGAKTSDNYNEGDIIGILPTANNEDANEFIDIAIPTSLDIARNIIVCNADAVVAIGGGAGTLTEMAIAWQLKKLIIAYQVEGWSGNLANKRIDHRIRYDNINNDMVYGVKSETEVIKILEDMLPKYNSTHYGIK